MKLHTDNQLRDYLDQEMSWRLKEIADIKLAVKTTSDPRRRSVIRAAIPIAYAHWEGFIKMASVAYLNYIQFQNVRYGDLITCFVVLGCKRHIQQVVGSQKALANAEMVNFLRLQMNEYARFSLATAIDVESNLSSSVFDNVANSIGIDTGRYQTKYKFIDESLVGRRNSIAHGEIHNIPPDDCRRICDQVLQLMREYKNDIENAVSLRKFRRQVQGQSAAAP